MNSKIKKILNKKKRSKIICLTAYSKNIAEEVDKYADITLVGDSLGSVLYNYDTTRKVTLTNMIDHSKSVRLGVKKSLMVVDMPYNTYNSKAIALKNAKKIIKETKCDAVKLEGGKNIINQVKFLIKNKIPVMGHLGILPQTSRGKFKSKGGTVREMKQLIKDSLLLQNSGVFSIVL
jgi:3-methyl-2-oxobutanoate hydroxymethyltransferase